MLSGGSTRDLLNRVPLVSPRSNKKECASESESENLTNVLNQDGPDFGLSPSLFDVEELRKKLREAQRTIELKNEALDKKDNDLVMAAELGSCLIEENERLKAMCEKYATNSTSEKDNIIIERKSIGNSPPVELHRVQKYNEELEGQVKQLQAALQSTQEEVSSKDFKIQKLTELKLAPGRNSAIITDENEVLSHRNLELMAKVKELEGSNAKLLSYNAKIVEHKAFLEKRLDTAPAIEDLMDQINKLKESNSKISSLNHQLESSKVALTMELDEKKAKIDNYCNEIEKLKLDIERMNERQSSLEWELESEREMSSKLQIQLASRDSSNVRSPQSKSGGGVLQKSLFSEIDDKRQELENKNVRILQIHNAYVRRQENIKAHVSKLAILANLKTSDSKIRCLEDALGQAESEKKELANRLSILEKRLEQIEENKIPAALAMSGFYFHKETSSHVTDNNISNNMLPIDESTSSLKKTSYKDNSIERECLSTVIDGLRDENSELKKEVRTLRMINIYETEKLRSMESLLRERENDIVRIKASALQLNMEMESLRSNIPKKSHTQSPSKLISSSSRLDLLESESQKSSSFSIDVQTSEQFIPLEVTTISEVSDISASKKRKSSSIDNSTICVELEDQTEKFADCTVESLGDNTKNLSAAEKCDDSVSQINTSFDLVSHGCRTEEPRRVHITNTKFKKPRETCDQQ